MLHFKSNPRMATPLYGLDDEELRHALKANRSDPSGEAFRQDRLDTSYLFYYNFELIRSDTGNEVAPPV